ncbi:hypothetical protein [Bythopirellula goksoeyrii]|nr:hypothetical protein [Bythopirellula goksoeyrii]
MEILLCFSSNAEEALYPEVIPIETEKLSILSPRVVERMVLPIRQLTFFGTAMDFGRTSLPPWEVGNYLRVSFTKAKMADSREERAEWSIVNIHSENFSLITKALEIEELEIVVLHNGRSNGSYRSVDNGWVETPLVYDNGYAIVTDARIPRKWFRLEPEERMDEKIRNDLMKYFPQAFRDPNKEPELKISHGNDPWPKLTIPGYSLYPEESNQ